MPNVLVIDDSSEMRSLVSMTLSVFGFGTCQAEDGMQGVRMALDSHPDVIICDVQMPGIDGFSTLLNLRDQAVTATIPFIFLTGSLDHKIFRRGMGCGADDFLTKPFSPQELVEAVASRIARSEELKTEYARRAERIQSEFLQIAAPALCEF